MNVKYDETQKHLPADQLHKLFKVVGWADGPETADMIKSMDKPFINSTLVISAWEEHRLVGVVRVLSDQIVRSEIYDLIVEPRFQRNGIGTELVKRCIEHFPNTEWFIRTTKDVSGFYEKIGFISNKDVILSIPSRYT